MESHSRINSTEFIVQIVWIISIIIIFILIILVFNKQIKRKEDEKEEPKSDNKIKNATYHLKERGDNIPLFETNVYFTPYPTTINIENKKDCSVRDLRKCKIDQPEELFGCRELFVKCQHFKKDTKYVEGQKTIIIPKNETPNDGYILQITALAKECNPYHGDLVLMSKTPDSTDYMLVCVCKYDGLIGKETLLGDCKSIYICDGKIDDINKPVEQINCKCEHLEYTVRYNNFEPVCKMMTVKKAQEVYANEDWSKYVNFVDQHFLSINEFNYTIQNNLKVKYLLNPCVRSLLDYKTLIPDAEYDNKSCAVAGSGLPARSSLFEPASISKHVKNFDSIVDIGSWKNLRIISNVVTPGSRFGIIVSSDKLKAQTTNIQYPPTISIEAPLNLGYSRYFRGTKQTHRLPLAYCNDLFPTYHCFFAAEKGIPNASNAKLTLGFLWQSSSNEAPSKFWWNRSDWLDATRITDEGIPILDNTNAQINYDHFHKGNSLNLYGMLVKSDKNIDPIGFTDTRNFKTFKSSLIDPNTTAE